MREVNLSTIFRLIRTRSRTVAEENCDDSIGEWPSNLTTQFIWAAIGMNREYTQLSKTDRAIVRIEIPLMYYFDVGLIV